jgi:SET domain-containing protein
MFKFFYKFFKLDRSEKSFYFEFFSPQGLFPLAALMNHHCIPNIRYTYDNNRVMTCKAVKPIKKGEQIFNSYTKVLWGTNQRRMHLYYSKNFLCKCERCVDNTEFGNI